MTRAAAELGEHIEQACPELAAELTERHFSRRPELAARFGMKGRAKCMDDARFHIRYLAATVALGAPALFAEYLAWARPMLASRRIPVEDLRSDIAELHAVLAERFPADRPALEAAIAPALARLDAAPDQLELPALPEPARRFFEAALHDPVEAALVAEELAANGLSLDALYVEVLQRAMHRAGELWQMNRLSVAEEHYFTAVTQRVIARLFSNALQRRGRGPTVVVACVAGEQHELGARMLNDVLELAGYRSHYLGAAMPPRAIVDFACLRNAKVLALSASITPHLGPLREAIGLARADPRSAELKLLVGGGPFNAVPELWRAVGADGWAPNAAAALAEVQRLAGTP
jgi:methanogenic corrinoid protein MtbC1